MQQWVPYPVGRVFAFFANPANLPPLMPSWQQAAIDSSSLVVPPAGPSPSLPGSAAGAGTRITISFRPIPFLPLRMRWDARITEFAWNDHFCDEQLSGPFAYWLHCHRVAEQSHDGVVGTLVVDNVQYEMKFGVLGDLANTLGGELQMRSLFRFRQRQLLRLLGA